jgi:CO/xanthine dehydrogenase FAD-binding subunit
MPCEYQQPSDLGAALVALAAEGALPIAGGTYLILRLRRREVAPHILVAISRLAELTGIRSDAGGLSIGAATTLAAVARSPEVLSAAPMLAELCGRVRSPQIRNAATLGGSVLSGPGYAEPALALLALGARVTLKGLLGEREIAVEELLADSGSLNPGELIVSFTVPTRTTGERFGAYRVARREAIEPPLVAAAVCLRLGAGGIADEVRVCLGVATPRPLRLAAVEDSLRGRVVTAEAARRAVEVALPEIPLRPDVRAREGYRRRMIPIAVARSVEVALERSR